MTVWSSGNGADVPEIASLMREGCHEQRGVALDQGGHGRLCIALRAAVDGGLDVVVLVLQGVDVLVRHDERAEGVGDAIGLDDGDVALLRAVVAGDSLAGQRLEGVEQVEALGQEAESRQQDLVSAQLREVVRRDGRELFAG